MPTKPKNGITSQNNSPHQDTFEPEPNTLVIEDQSLRYGFIQLPRQILYARNLSHAAKLLYAILLGYAWQEGSCFPGYERLEEDMQAGRKMIRRYMRELEAIALVSQRRRGQGKTNIYILRDLRTVKLELPDRLNFQKGQNDPSRRVKRDHLDESKSPSNNKQSDNNQINNNDVVVEQLQNFGVSATSAKQLFKSYPEDYIIDKLDLAQWLVAIGSPLIRKNPAGWLIRAIEDDFQPPQGYEAPSLRKARSERQAQAAAAEAEQRRQAEQDYQLAQAEARKRIRENHPPEPVGETGLTTETAWHLTLQKMEEQLSKGMFHTWLKNTTLLSVEGNQANVIVPNQTTADWIERRLYQSLVSTFTKVIDQDADFRFIVTPIPPVLVP